MPELSDITRDFAYKESSIKLLLLFQRHLLANIYSYFTNHTPNHTPNHPHSPTPAVEGDFTAKEQVEGALAVLVKYIAMLHHHVVQVLQVASQLVSCTPHHFTTVSRVLKEGPVVMLLPELSVSMVLLQLRIPCVFLASKCVSLVGELVKFLDDFNQLAPGALQEEEQDMAWPDTYSEYLKNTLLLAGTNLAILLY